MLGIIVLIVILCIVLAIFVISFLCVKIVKTSHKKVCEKNIVRRNTPFYNGWNAVGLNNHNFSGDSFDDFGISGGECGIGDRGSIATGCGSGDCGGSE